MKQRHKLSAEQQRYWTEFESNRHQFFKVMTGDNFNYELKIPREFKDNFKEKLPETVGLIGPSGHVWEVKLRQGANEWLFHEGWEEFVEDHGLEESDFMVFHYEDYSKFKVSIFTKSGCERGDAYFAKKKRRKAKILPSVCSQKKKRMTEYVDLVTPLGNSESSEGDPLAFESDQGSNSDSATRPGHSKEGIRRHGTAGKAQTNAGDCQGTSKEMRLIPGKSYSVYLVSKRREVSLEEIQSAYNRAIKHKSIKPSLTLVMKPTNVYKYFSVCIPKQWAKDHMPRTNNSKVQLKVPPCKKIWHVQWKCDSKTAFSRGWFRFVKDNNLEEHDACVFQLIKGGKGTKETPVFNVIIFRVVDEYVPLTRLDCNKPDQLIK